MKEKLEKAREWARNHNYDMWEVGKPTNLVIVGEAHTHNENNPIKVAQRELVEAIKPAYLLDEYHAKTLIFDHKKRKWSVHPGVRRGRYETEEIPQVIEEARFLERMALTNGFTLVGIDMSEEEKSGEDQTDMHYMVPRNERMAQRCIEYSLKTERPVIAQMGAEHMDRQSTIHSKLEGKIPGYLCINQRGRK